MVEFDKIIWRDRTGEVLSCREKIKVLTENLTELNTIAQDVFEEALLLKADEQQIREVLKKIMDEMENPYA